MAEYKLIRRIFDKWIFNCPTHGIESEATCFRSSKIEYVDSWEKVRVTEDLIETSNEERLEHLECVQLQGMDE